jgi:outer membrane protein
MSAERPVRLRRACAAALVAACTAAVSAQGAGAGQDPVDADRAAPVQVDSPRFPYLLDDPLRAGARAPAATLPGDGEAWSCPPAPDPGRLLALEDAVDFALCGNAQARSAWAAVKVQAAALGQARAEWLPTVNATVTQQRTRTWYPGFTAADSGASGHTVYGSVNWRLFDFGTRAADNAYAGRLLEAALASRDAVLQKTLAGVVAAYFDAMTAAAALDARRDAARFAQRTLETTERREARDAAAVGDTLQARTALARARLAEQRATGDFRKGVAVLVYAMGLPAGSELLLPIEVAPPHPEAVAALGDWLSQARDHHPAIRAARAQVEAARAKAESVRLQGLPSIDLTGNYYQNGYPNQSLQPTRSATVAVGLQLNVPLFEGLARTYQVRGAQAQVEQSRAQLEDTEGQVLSAIVKDHADATAALENLDASAAWLRAAGQAVDSSQRRYEKGVADVLELLGAQSALADAQQERVRCLSEWRAARLKLAADAGSLGRAGLGAAER